jgi:hypothetical protein
LSTVGALPDAEVGQFVELPIDSALVDTDGSEGLVITISGLPANTTLLNDAGQTFTPSGGQVELTRGQLAGLSLSTTTAGTFTLNVAATATEDVGGQAVAGPLPVELTVFDPPPPPSETGGPSVQPGTNDGGGPRQGTGGGQDGNDGGDDGGIGFGGLQDALQSFAGGTSLTDVEFEQGGDDDGGISLLVVGSPTDQLALVDVTRSFQVPENTFQHTDPDERLSYEATQANGEPLPNWIVFDPETLTFSSTAPVGAEGVYELSVIARDSAGNEAEASFRLVVTRDNEATEGDEGGDEEAPAPAELEVDPAGEQESRLPEESDPWMIYMQELLDQVDARDPEQAMTRLLADLGLVPQDGTPGPAEPGGDRGAAAARSPFTAQLRAAGAPGALDAGRALLTSLRDGAERNDKTDARTSS